MMYEPNSSPISISQDINIATNRFMGLSKSDILKSCWLSIQEGLTPTDTIHLLAVHVTDSTKKWLEETCKANLIIVDFPAIDEYTPPYGEHPYPNFHEVRINHFIPQYTYFIQEIEKNPNDIYYLCNDDYLHLPDTMTKIKELFKDGFNGFLVPQDNPDCYTDQTRQSELYLSKYGYLRTIKVSTPTVVASGNLWLYFKYDILKSSVFASDYWTWRAYSLAKALTPIPSWSTHLQNNCLAPYIDWAMVAQTYLKNANH